MLRVRTVFSGPAGTPWLSTMYFTAAPEDQAAAAAAVAAVGAWWNAVDALISTSVTWATDAEVIRLDLDGTQEVSFTVTPATGTGAATSDMLPAATQGLMRWRTGTFLNGKELRGRTFIPGIAEASATLGDLAAGAQTIFNAAAAALINDANSQLVVWSKRLSLTASIQSGQAWTKFAVLRSRRD